MSQNGTRIWGLFFLLVGVSAAPALGADAADSQSNSEELAQLETLLRSQQNRIGLLEQKLAGAQGRNQDAARAEVMKRQIREVLSEQEFRESLMPSSLQAGYDIVYVYAGHSLTVLQHFLSPRYNHRTDEYGGSLRNRTRLLQEVLEDTLEEVGGRAAVACRIAVDELSVLNPGDCIRT